MKKMFILGGSSLQIDLLEEAKKSYYVILIDGNGDCALRDKANEFFELDFSDTDKLYELAIEKRPSLILTMASEQGNLSAAIVSQKLGINYNDIEVVYSTVNKAVMKQKMVDSKIQTSNYSIIDKSQNDINIWDKAEFPLVVKPSQSSGGRGVKLINSLEELNKAAAAAKQISNDGCAIVEEYIVGDQYSVETITCNGNHHILGITREYFSSTPYFAETQQLYPADINRVLNSKVKQFINDVLNGFQIKYGACHIEIRVTSSGEIYLIEIASRMGGWRNELVKYSTGINYVRLLIESYEKDIIEVKYKFDKYCLVKMIFSKEDLKLYKSFLTNPVYEITPIVWLKDDFTENITSLMDSSGYYYIIANNIEEALDAL